MKTFEDAPGYEDLDPQHRDALTGLPNRLWLDENLPIVVDRYPDNFGLLFLDIDGLKPVNEIKGHGYGDQLIRETGRIAQESIRIKPRVGKDADILSRVAVRLSGDEFVLVIMEVKSEETLGMIKNRVQSNLSENGIETSLGGLLHQGHSAEQMLIEADQLMLVNKRLRKGEAYSPVQIETAISLGRLATEAGINLRDMSVIFDLFGEKS